MPDTLQQVQTQNYKVDLSTFIKEDPEFWFIIVERELETAGITDSKTKTISLIKVLPPHLRDAAKQIITNLTTLDTPFEDLKTLVIKTTVPPESARITQILERERRGGRKVSVFLQHLRLLSGGVNSDNNPFLRSIIIRELPEKIKVIIASGKTGTLDDIADTADAILEQLPSLDEGANQISNIAHETRDPVPTTPEVPQLCHLTNIMSELKMQGRSQQSEKISSEKQITHLIAVIDKMQDETRRNFSQMSQQISDLRREVYNKSRDRSRSTSLPRSGNNSNYSRNPGVCWIHQKYGANAYSCKQPCNFRSGHNELSNQPPAGK